VPQASWSYRNRGAEALGVTCKALSDLVNGHTGVSPDMIDLRFAFRVNETKTVPRHRIYRGCFLTWSAFILWLPDRRPPSHECSRNRAFMHYAPSNAARARLGDLDWMGRQCSAVHFDGGQAEVAQYGRGDVDQ
jgi:hypothetical protein